MFNSIGTLIYSENPYKLIVDLDNEIANYYRSLIPKYLNVRKPLYQAHISVIRNEIPLNLNKWEKYNQLPINIMYDNIIYNNGIYYWLNAIMPSLENIRLELGIPNISDYTKSPDGQHKFHITIGNTKHLL